MKSPLGCTIRVVIVSRDNRYLKDLRRLRHTRSDERALLEGPHLVIAACEAGIELEYSLATPQFLASAAAAPVLAALPRAPRPVTADLLDELADADTPRGLVAVARPATARIDDLPGRLSGPLVFAEGLQDPGNLGALARATEAAGGCGLALAPGTVHPFHPRALRGSAGSLLRLPVVRTVELDALRRHYPAPATRLVALSPRDGADLYETDFGAGDGDGVILLVGAEGAGLSSAARTAADLHVTIPMAPAVESLNTTVAAAVALFEIARRRRP